MAGYREVGDFLRLWRIERTNLTQADVAVRLGLTEQCISNWECARRDIRTSDVAQLDDVYGAAGALSDMVRAMGSRHGLPAHRRWAYNRVGRGGPHWAWLRPYPNPGGEKNRLRAQVSWCGFALDIDELCDESGVVVQFPSSDPGLPVRVDLTEPGWVDNGTARILPGLGLSLHDFLDACRPVDECSLTGLMARRHADHYLEDTQVARQQRAFFGTRPDVVDMVAEANRTRTRPLESTTNGRVILPLPDDPVRDPLTGSPAGRPFSPTDFERLRAARCFPERQIAREAGELGAAPFDEGVWSRFKGGSEPRDPHFRALLDRIFFADGWTLQDQIARIPTATYRSPFVLSVPDFWVGPVWMAFEQDAATQPADGPNEVEISWREASVTVKIAPADVLSWRRPYMGADDLVVACPPDWRLTAGMGFHPEARELDFDHWTVSGQGIYRDFGVHPRLLNLFGIAAEDLPSAD